ncbi:MAG TPA: chemotaxis response regulator protein-glutamate methylesterase [Blastocatellia bacterium]|nr:chemotaxis response regulator protein-glutamate methylesterase [Blastocatellia bacterium]
MIRVLVVDDSAVVRQVLTDGLASFSDIEVVGTAVDPYVARDKIAQLKPDVLTLDIEMPRMDGLSFLSKLMKHYPLPVVVVSSLAPEHSELALRALSEGAIDVIAKPGSTYSTPDFGRLARAVRAAAASRPTRRQEQTEKPPAITQMKTTNTILAIGASTGGTTAIETVLRGIPANGPGTVIVQHMPEGFTRTFAERLNGVCQMQVSEARDNDIITPGVALVAPGNQHMIVKRSGTCFMVELKDGPLVYYQRPAVELMFQSVARSAGRNAVGVILTGMGADGSKGLLEMRNAGAYTIAQDEQSSVVFGMPKEAIKLGGATEVLPLGKIAGAVLNYIGKSS